MMLKKVGFVLCDAIKIEDYYYYSLSIIIELTCHTCFLCLVNHFVYIQLAGKCNDYVKICVANKTNICVSVTNEIIQTVLVPTHASVTCARQVGDIFILCVHVA